MPAFAVACAQPVWAQAATDDVADYAKRCYARAGIDIAKLKSKAYRCEDGTQLFTTEQGVIRDLSIKRAPGNRVANKDAIVKTPPKSCDRPAWLEDPTTCYGNTYVQELAEFSAQNANVKAVLMCRHKNKFRLEDDPRKFRDVAMIVHNRQNGETCWFQSPNASDDSHEIDGTSVPAPHGYAPNPAAAGDPAWLKPTVTAGIGCITCHDNGPWMSSRWISDKFGHNPAATEPEMQDGRKPYVSSGIGFDDWQSRYAPVRVTIGRAGLADRSLQSCTTCHYMAGKGSGDSQSLARWLDYSIGRKFPDQANAKGREFQIAAWMPPDHGLANKADWDKAYDKHVGMLKRCMENNGAVPGNALPECGVAAPKLNTAPSPVPGARLEASLDGGRTWPYVAELPAPGSKPRKLPAVRLLDAATSLTLRWQGDASHLYCSIEPSFPAGVTAPGGMRTGSYFGLPDSGNDRPVHVGMLSAPGEYRIDMHCDPSLSASLTFIVPGQQVAWLLVQAVADRRAGPAASTLAAPGSTVAQARPTDAVEIVWRAEHVVPGSCRLVELDALGRATGRTRQSDFGYETVAWDGRHQRSYELSCLGTDRRARSVRTEVRPVPALACDADGDGTVDGRDLALIQAARGRSVAIGDPRDANADGLISEEDARLCSQR